MPNPEQLSAFVEWYQRCITGDEKGQAQIFLDRLFQGFGLPGSLDVGGSPEFRVLKSAEDGGGTSFADYVWKPVLWPQFEMGSATGPVAESGGPPDSRSTKISPPEKSDERGFRRAAENDGRAARAPQISDSSDLKKIEAVAEAGREVRRVRAEALPKMKGGLRALYRTLELPGANPLKDAHAALDTAVLNAYGFSPKKDILAQLLSLNQQVASKIEMGEPVTAPGVPKNYPDPKKLVTEDCVKPLDH